MDLIIVEILSHAKEAVAPIHTTSNRKGTSLFAINPNIWNNNQKSPSMSDATFSGVSQF